MTSAVILGMIVTMFTEPQERTRAISLYSFVAAAGASIGLLAGGVLTELLDWHWIFFVNVPIGIVTGLLAVRLIKDDVGLGLGKGADVPGAILVTAALMLGVLTIIRTSDVGWFSIETLVGAAATALAFAGFVVREHRTSDPLLPLRIFRSRAVTGANLIMVLVVAGFFGTFFIGSLYLERVLHFDALAIGLGFLPISVSIGVMSFVFAVPLITRFGQRAVLRGGLVLLLAGMLWLARLPADATYLVDVGPGLLLIGIGAGLTFPSTVGLAMSGATNADAGLASGLVNTTRMVGGSLGLAVMASLLTTRVGTLATAGADLGTALTGGAQLAMSFAAAVDRRSVGHLGHGAPPEHGDPGPSGRPAHDRCRRVGGRGLRSTRRADVMANHGNAASPILQRLDVGPGPEDAHDRGRWFRATGLAIDRSPQMAFMTSSTCTQGVAYARIGAATIVTRYRTGDLDTPTHDLVDRYREVCMAMGEASKPIIDDAVRAAVEKWAEALSEDDEDTEAHWMQAASSMLAGYMLGAGQAVL